MHKKSDHTERHVFLLAGCEMLFKHMPFSEVAVTYTNFIMVNKNSTF